MKKMSSDLHSLIGSMTKTEKRYFHVYAGRHFPKDNQYARLFAAIDKQKEYDEQALATQFSQGRSASHFAVIKNQLYAEVLQSLTRYHEAQDAEMQLTNASYHCQILLRKGLYRQCLQQIHKYLHIAQELDQHETLIALLDTEKKVHMRMQFTSMETGRLEVIRKTQEKACALLVEEATYQFDIGTIYALHYQKRITQGKTLPVFERMMREERYRDIRFARSFASRLDFLQMHALHAFIHGDAEKAYHYNAQFLEWMEAHPKHMRGYSERYFSVLNNWLIDSLLLQKKDALFKGIERLRALTGEPAFRNIQNLEAIVFRQSYILEMNYYTQMKAYGDILQTASNVQTGMRTYQRELALPHVVTMRFLLAQAYFFSTAYGSCLDELEILLRMKHADTISDLHRDARIMQLLSHFMLGNYQLCESLITSLQRSLLKQKNTFKTYSELFSFLKKHMFDIQKPDIRAFRKKLEVLAKKEKTVFGNFDLLQWADGRGLTKE